MAQDHTEWDGPRTEPNNCVRGKPLQKHGAIDRRIDRHEQFHAAEEENGRAEIPVCRVT